MEGLLHRNDTFHQNNIDSDSALRMTLSGMLLYSRTDIANSKTGTI
jgi:hypothetical protein